MARLCSSAGEPLMWLFATERSVPCESSVELLADGPVLHLQAARPGRVGLEVTNVGISPACYFYFLREASGQRVNDFDELELNRQETIGGGFGTGSTIDALAGEDTWFTLHVSPAVEGSNGESSADLRNCAWSNAPTNTFFVETQTRFVTLQVTDTMTTTDLMRILEEEIGTSRSSTLLYQAERLTEGVPLKQYKIGAGSTLGLATEDDFIVGLSMPRITKLAMPPSTELALASVLPGAAVRAERRTRPEGGGPPLRVRVSVRST